MKRELPVIVSAVAGLIIILEYFFKIDSIRVAAGSLQDWGIIIAAFALALAAANLAKIHIQKVSKGDRQSFHSAILLVGLLATLISGVTNQKSDMFKFIFEGLYTPLAAAFYSMTAFHLASASYRAFRAKNAQAAALLVTGVLLMIGRAPIGEVVWREFPKIANWIMSVVNLAGSRGILISTAVGLTGVGLRVLLGIDRAHLGGSGE